MTSEHVPGGDTPDQISRRYHLIRVVVTIAVMGAVTLLIGLASLVDPDNARTGAYLGGCLAVAVVSVILLLVLRRPDLSITAVDVVMIIGLLATFANTIYGGLLEVDPWWQVCAYLVVIMIAGGVSIRRSGTFAFFILVGIASWIVVINDQGLSETFIFDTYVLMGLGSIVSGAILVLFRTERRRVVALNEELLLKATHDSLTGILNRVGLLHALSPASDGSPPPFNPTWCACLDVDYFKSINDRRGHDHGDRVLRLIADAIERTSTESSLAARWGGDEFVLVGAGAVPGEEELEDTVNDRIAEIEPGGTVSVGVSESEAGDGIGLTDLLNRADKRMYERRNEMRAELTSAR